MSADIIPFYPGALPHQPVATFFRVGETGHQIARDQLASGKLRAKRAVFDASVLHHQKELLKEFQLDAAETVLDTKLAELASPLKVLGRVKHAPWASEIAGEVIGPDKFNEGSSLFEKVAEYAVEHSFKTVLAPSHFWRTGHKSDWLRTDLNSVLHLRDALDRAGGDSIEIDLPLIVPHTVLSDQEFRSELLSSLPDLPFRAVWIRASNFGPSDVTPAGLRRFILSVAALHNLGKPIVGDYLGGFPGLSALSFGSLSGLASGFGTQERFDARNWHKLPKPDEDGANGKGRARRLLISSLDKSLLQKEFEALVQAKGGRRLLSCDDRKCCAHGATSMLQDHRGHAVHQRLKQIEDIEGTPVRARAKHLLDQHVTPAVALAGRVAQLRLSAAKCRELGVDEERLKGRLHKSHAQMHRLLSTLERLYDDCSDQLPAARPLEDPREARRRHDANQRD